MMMIMMIAMMCSMAKSELINVGGGKYGWVPGNNLTQWALNQHFYVNEWLCKFSSLILFCFFLIFFKYKYIQLHTF